MKNKLMNFLISTIKLGITVTILLFGFLIWEEIEPLLNNYESEENYELIGSFNLDEIKEKENIKIPEVINSNIIDNIQSAASNNKENNNQNIDYSNVSIDKYFYNQLNDYSKTIYRAFESNKENMKNGRYQIDFGNTFSKILDLENGQDLLGKYYQSAIEAYTYDNPDVFYLSPNKMYLNIETTTKAFLKTYNVYINSGKQANYLIDEFNSKEQIDLAISKIEEIRNQITRNLTGNDYKDVKMIHDYLVDNVEYDTSISKPNIYNIYGTLVNKEVVCEGYARTFKYLLDYIKIPSTIVIGKGMNSKGETENHAWNYVKINNKWYAIDCTWDDPVIVGGGRLSESSKYKYFLKGSLEFNQDHSPSTRFTGEGQEFTYPPISEQNLL